MDLQEWTLEATQGSGSLEAKHGNGDRHATIDVLLLEFLRRNVLRTNAWDLSSHVRASVDFDWRHGFLRLHYLTVVKFVVKGSCPFDESGCCRHDAGKRSVEDRFWRPHLTLSHAMTVFRTGLLVQTDATALGREL